MEVSDVTVDLSKFQECFGYIQSSLKGLLASDRASQVAMFSPDLLEETIAATKALLPDLASLKNNTQAPISRLPSEIFSHILLFLKDDYMPFPNPIDLREGSYYPNSIDSWHRASLVCRRWRQEVLGTPELWTTIKISDDADAVYRWAPTWLSRSGALPLTVLFDTEVEKHRIHQDDIQRILLEKDRIHALGFYQSVDETDLELILTQVAGQLKTLWTVYPNNFCAQDHPPCELPRLQVLSVALGNLWWMRPMRDLRSLVLGCKGEEVEWFAKDLYGFLATLAANPRIEELVLCRIGISEGTWSTMLDTYEDLHPSVRMERIKRLFVEERRFDTDQLPMVTVLEDTLSLPPTCTRYYHIPTYPVRFKRRTIYPIKKLVVSLNCLIGTDGTSICISLNSMYSSYNFRAGLLAGAPVQELWLHRTAVWKDRGGVSSIDDIPTVTKLVLEEGITLWLENLESAFPALKEMHILAQLHNDKKAILQFLARRKETGMGVDTLCFVGGPYNSEAFDVWKEDPSEFERLTGRVIFEDVRGIRGSPFWHLMLTRLGLPEACTRPSPTNTIWQPWTKLARLC